MLDEQSVRAALNGIADPCSAARGVPIGLVDMGLVRNVAITESDEGAGPIVDLVLRITSPGCTLSLDFERRARVELATRGASEVRVQWDTTFDWTHRDIAPAARQRLDQYREAIRSRV